jgi:hypothetical protein
MFKRLQILRSLTCEYIFSLMNFTVNNKVHFQPNSAVYSINTRNMHQLYTAMVNLLMFPENYILWWHQHFQQFTIQSEKSYE